MTRVLTHFQTNGDGAHVVVIDPDDQTPEIAAKRVIASIIAGTQAIFVGGSTAVDGTPVHDTVIAIKEAIELCRWNSTQDSESDEEKWDVPVLLFPAGARALSPAADAITYMSLMNSRNLQFVMGEQVIGAPIVEKMGIEAIPMGYIVFAPGGKVGAVGEANLIESDDIDGAVAYALAAKMLGFKMVYLEAGSGVDRPVNPRIVHAVREAIPELVLIVGGGMKSGELAQAAVRAGADWIVTGNLTEEYDDASELENVMREYIQKMRE